MKITLAFSFIVFLIQPSFPQKDCKTQFSSTRLMSKTELLELADTLLNIEFETKYSIDSIPSFLMEFLVCYADEFRIVNPDSPYQAGDAIVGDLPSRQLTYLKSTDEYLILLYIHGGGSGWHRHVLIFNFSNKKILRFWNSYLEVYLKKRKKRLAYFFKSVRKNKNFLPDHF